jgi:hypothetical protein
MLEIESRNERGSDDQWDKNGKGLSHMRAQKDGASMFPRHQQ